MGLDNEEDASTPFRRSRLSEGPHELGDPDDKSLRKVETNVLIPEWMRTKARKELCKDINLEFANCCREHGFLMAFKCQRQSQNLKNCVKSYFEDPEFRELCTKEYLAERSEYRRTGLNKKQRAALAQEQSQA